MGNSLPNKRSKGAAKMKDNFLDSLKLVHRNLRVPQLVERALLRGEGHLTSSGALAVSTGKYTGRSPDDRFIVDEPATHEHIAWGDVNRPISSECYRNLRTKLEDYLRNQDEVFVFDGHVGASSKHRLRIRVINELASQNLFSTQIFIRPEGDELSGLQPEFTVIAAPGFKADPAVDGTHSEAFVIISFAERTVKGGSISLAAAITSIGTS